MGRGSALPRLLAAAGGDAVHEDAEDSGFLYYTRYFRGEAARAARADQHAGRHVLDPHAARRQRHVVRHALRLLARPAAEGAARPGDAGPTLVARLPAPRALARRASRSRRVMAMGGIVDRLRCLNGNGAGPALGVVSLGDAWACTNPSHGPRHVARPRPRRAAAARRARARRPARRADVGASPPTPSASCCRGTSARCPSTARGWRRSTRCAPARRRPPPITPARVGRALRVGDEPRPRCLPRRAGHHRPASRCRARSSRGPASPNGCSSRRRRLDAVRFGPDRKELLALLALR